MNDKNLLTISTRLFKDNRSDFSKLISFLGAFIVFSICAFAHAQEAEVVGEEELAADTAESKDMGAEIKDPEGETPPEPEVEGPEAPEIVDEEAQDDGAEVPVDMTGEEAKPKLTLDWLITIAALAGWLRNETTVRFKTPTKDPDKFSERKLVLTGDGWGAGLVLAGFYKWIQIANIAYLFPNVNNTIMWGNIFMVGVPIKTGTWVEPFIGMGLAYIGTYTHVKEFEYYSYDHTDYSPTIGYAYFEELEISTHNFEPLPKVGVTFKLPIQHWTVRPYYEFLYENLRAHARTPGGVVEVYRREDGYYQYPIEVIFDGTKVTEYMSNVVGLDFRIDYNYFAMLQGSVYYNITHDLLSTRIQGSLLFSRHFGAAVYFEYQDMIMVDNMFVMFGPIIYFTPSGFYDRILEMKNAAMERRRIEKEQLNK